MEESLKFKIWALDHDHAPFGGILSRMRWDLHRSIRVPDLKFLASSVPVSGMSVFRRLRKCGERIKKKMNSPQNIMVAYNRKVYTYCQSVRHG